MKDLTIVGAGPVGIYAATYAALRKMSVNLIDSMSNVGGQLTALYGDKYIYDLPGYDKIKANDFITNLMNQLQLNNEDNLVDIFLNQEVVKIDKVNDYFEIRNSIGEVFKSKTILLTSGTGMFIPRKIGIENEELYDNIIYAVNNLEQFKDKSITILGGGDSALDWAMMLEPIAKNINIVHRRDEYRAKEDAIEKLNKSSVKQYMSYLVKELKGNNNQLEKLIIEHKENSNIVELEQDYVLVNYGNITKISDFGGLDLNKDEFGYQVNQVLETNIDGIFACGNAINYIGRPKLITVGLGEVPVVINNIKGYVDPSSKNKIFYSSSSK